MLIQDPASAEVRQLHLEHAEFNVTFDIFSGTMILKQTVRDPAVSPTVQHVTSVYFNQSNTTFVNLEGLADNSLLFTFKLKASTSPTPTPTKKSNHKTERKQKSTPSELKVRVRDHGFLTNQTPFFKAFTNWKGDEKIMQLRLPDNRINSWKTVALVLLTYREINIDIWHRMVNDERMGDVAGLNWAHVRDRVGASNPDINTRAISNLPVRDESAKKTKTAIEARLIALQTGMGFKGLSGLGSAESRPYVLDQALHPGDLGFRGR